MSNKVGCCIIDIGNPSCEYVSVRDNLIVPYGEVPFLCLFARLFYQWFEESNNYEICSYRKFYWNLLSGSFVCNDWLILAPRVVNICAEVVNSECCIHKGFPYILNKRKTHKTQCFTSQNQNPLLYNKFIAVTLPNTAKNIVNIRIK